MSETPDEEAFERRIAEEALREREVSALENIAEQLERIAHILGSEDT